MRPICLFLGAVIALGGCALVGDDGPSAPPAPAPITTMAPADMLRPGDSLHIVVAGEEEFSGNFAVAGDGTVHLELVGALPAAGLSLPAFQDALRRRLAEGYLKDPQVQVARNAPLIAPSPQIAPQTADGFLPAPARELPPQTPALRSSQNGG